MSEKSGGICGMIAVPIPPVLTPTLIAPLISSFSREGWAVMTKVQERAWVHNRKKFMVLFWATPYSGGAIVGLDPITIFAAALPSSVKESIQNTFSAPKASM